VARPRGDGSAGDGSGDGGTGADGIDRDGAVCGAATIRTGYPG